MNEPAAIDSKRLVAINSATKYAALVVINLLTFFLTPYLIRTLGPTLLGLKTLAFQALQFVGLAHTAMGISYERYAKVNFARGEYDEMNSNLSAGFLVSAISGALFAVGSIVMAVFARQLFGLPDEILPTARWVFILIGFSTGLLIFTGVWETPAFVTERLYLPELGNLICSILAAVGVVLAFEVGHPSIIVWVLLSNGLLILWRVGVMIPLAYRLVPALRIGFSRIRSSGQIRELMAFGGLNFIGGVGYLLYYASDSIIISNLRELGPEMIVYYNVAQRWDPQIRVLVMAFVGSMLPMMTSLVSLKQTDRLISVFLRGTRYSILIGALPAVLLIVFARPFLAHWVGADFARVSAPCLQLVMLQFVLCIPERMAYNVNIAYGRMGGPVTVSLLCGVLNIILSVAFVKTLGMGLLGIAAGSVIALAIVCAYSIAYTLRLLKLPVIPWFSGGCARAAFASVPLVAASLAMLAWWPAPNLWIVLVQFGIGAIVHAIAAWFIGLQPAERGEILGTARRVLARRTGNASS